MNSLFKVNGKDFFSIGGQVNNSTSYKPERVEEACKFCSEIKMNTIAMPVYWEKFEPEEGVFDPTILHNLIDNAKKYNLKLVVLWFGTWKNGNSHYTPRWVKLDRKRFRWAKGTDGLPVATLSPHCEETKQADKTAFVELCKRIKSYDKSDTVISVQVQNEPGLIGTSRDYDESVTKLLNDEVPEIVAKHYNKSGTWEDLFGKDAGEFLTSYAIACYCEEIAAAGKEILPLPMYTNVWIGEMYNKVPGSNYPSGGAVCKTLELFRLCSPSLDTIAPDIYLQDRDTWDLMNSTYGDGKQPYYLPESLGSGLGVTMAMKAVAEHNMCGIHYFGIDMYASAQGPLAQLASEGIEAINILSSSKHLIEKYQGTGKLHAVYQLEGMISQSIDFGDYTGSVRYMNNSGSLFNMGASGGMDSRHFAKPGATEKAKGFIVYEGNGVFYITGAHYKLMLFPTRTVELSTGAAHSADFLNVRTIPYLSVTEGYFDEDGEYVVTNNRSGDEVDAGFWTAADVGVVRIELNPDFFEEV